MRIRISVLAYVNGTLLLRMRPFVLTFACVLCAEAAGQLHRLTATSALIRRAGYYHRLVRMACVQSCARMDDIAGYVTVAIVNTLQSMYDCCDS